jgi:hypothetical protein
MQVEELIAFYNKNSKSLAKAFQRLDEDLFQAYQSCLEKNATHFGYVQVTYFALLHAVQEENSKRLNKTIERLQKLGKLKDDKLFKQLEDWEENEWKQFEKYQASLLDSQKQNENIKKAVEAGLIYQILFKTHHVHGIGLSEHAQQNLMPFFKLALQKYGPNIPWIILQNGGITISHEVLTDLFKCTHTIILRKGKLETNEAIKVSDDFINSLLKAKQAADKACQVKHIHLVNAYITLDSLEKLIANFSAHGAVTFDLIVNGKGYLVTTYENMESAASRKLEFHCSLNQQMANKIQSLLANEYYVIKFFAQGLDNMDWSMPHVNTIEINNIMISPTLIDSIKKIHINFPNLHCLSLSKLDFISFAVKSDLLSTLKTFNKLNSLSIKESQLSDEQIPVLLDLIFTRIRLELDIKSNNFTLEGNERIKQAIEDREAYMQAFVKINEAELFLTNYSGNIVVEDFSQLSTKLNAQIELVFEQQVNLQILATKAYPKIHDLLDGSYEIIRKLLVEHVKLVSSLAIEKRWVLYKGLSVLMEKNLKKFTCVEKVISCFEPFYFGYFSVLLELFNIIDISKAEEKNAISDSETLMELCSLASQIVKAVSDNQNLKYLAEIIQKKAYENQFRYYIDASNFKLAELLLKKIKKDFGIDYERYFYEKRANYFKGEASQSDNLANAFHQYSYALDDLKNIADKNQQKAVVISIMKEILEKLSNKYKKIKT